MKKNQIKLLVFSVSMFMLFQPGITSYAHEVETPVVEISPYSQLIEYRYKVEDGKVYRRLYNYYTQQWVGNWELCP